MKSANKLFESALEINRAAMKAQLFDAAYHALCSAFHLAKAIESDEPLERVGRLAREQIDFIDREYPGYQHSSRSSQKRLGGANIFSTLAIQAETTLAIRRHYRKVLSGKIQYPVSLGSPPQEKEEEA